MAEHRYIVLEGPIGVGKTSLCHLLEKEFSGRLVLEEVEENPFLTEFYQDRQRMALQTQLFFLLSRYRQQQEIIQPSLFGQATISDYLFAKDRIFAYLNLDDNELALYNQIYELLEPTVPKPDLVIYLQASTEVLMQRIGLRGKDYEKGISREYINDLNEAYNHFFFNYTDTPLLVINTTEIDFVSSRKDLVDLVQRIKEMRKGTHYYIPMASR